MTQPLPDWRRMESHETLCRFRAARNCTGRFQIKSVEKMGTNMSTVAADRKCKIELTDGMSLWLATPQQRAAAGYVVNEVFKKHRYNYPGFQIQSTDIIVDIGANMGVFVLWAAKQATQ